MTTNQIQIAKAIVAMVEIEKEKAKLEQEIQALSQAIEENAKRAFKEEK